MMTLKDLHRRTFLRGMLQGSAVVVALPLLDVFLDPHGESIAKPGPDGDTRSSSEGLLKPFKRHLVQRVLRRSWFS